ncbi:unnamed protein product [Clavelina lepadiformis]|uniref:NadR/Ttd14 AAA domain-containing protein n=1 Tax=Clavelina lepadiformis TaxID=159417 RepID=A0ABP0H2I3_CLALP
MKRVHVCGAHSTGKTTMIDHCKKYVKAKGKNVLYSEEIARNVLTENKITANDQKDINVFKRLNCLILERQCAREIQMKALSDENNCLCIYDRGILDPICYLHLYVGAEAAEDALSKSSILKWAHDLTNAEKVLVFVMKPSPNCLCNDDVRIDTKNFEEIVRYDTFMKKFFSEMKINFRYIEKEDIVERVKFVVDATLEVWPDLPIKIEL